MKLMCREVSGLDCPYEAEGDTAEEVRQKLSEHGMEEHADEMAAMTDDEKKAMEERIDELLAQQA